ncbi:MAG: chemotaxis protein CheB, partial [Hyphomicrobiaceae bacterium]
MSQNPREDDKAARPVVCAIGASAGGVKALQNLFSALEQDLDLAYVVIIHLSPDHPSQLSEILAGRTQMPVLQVDDSPRLKGDCVYVIAPDRELVIEDGHVTSRPISEPRSRRAPIDLFFRSIAQSRGDGIAVLLSGSGSDGALGVKAMKEAGGVILVQEPSDAEYANMPRSAIATGAVDFVGTVPQLAARIAEIVRNKSAIQKLKKQDTEAEVRRILAFLRARTGHDFASYNRNTVMRRIARRMQITRQVTFEAYREFVRINPEEAQELFSDLLISVTSFFRDPAVFEVVSTSAIGPIFDRLGADEPLRAW